MIQELHRRHMLALALTASAGPALAEPQKGLRFAALGDFGREGKFHQKAVARALERWAGNGPCDFILALGDNFYDSGVQTVHDDHWRVSFEDVYDPKILSAPWYAILGNHDYGGEPQAQIAYGRISPRWKMPSRYYAMRHRGLGRSLDFFMIDTSPLVADPTTDPTEGAGWRSITLEGRAQQLKWLDAALGASKADFKIVAGHHPVYSGGDHGDTDAMIERVLPILKRHRVDLYLNGHDHDLQYIERDGMAFLCSGSASQIRPCASGPGSRFQASLPGFAGFELQRDHLDIRFHGADDAVLFQTRITPRRPV